MKKLILITIIIFTFLIPLKIKSQVQIIFNIEEQPLWGPINYNYVQYYYLPEYNIYYDVINKEYIFFNGLHWVFTKFLPSRYGHINLYTTYKVVINERNPYMRHKYYYNKYKNSYHRHNQIVIRDSRNQRYFGVKGHPYYNKRYENKYRRQNVHPNIQNRYKNAHPNKQNSQRNIESNRSQNRYEKSHPNNQNRKRNIESNRLQNRYEKSNRRR